MKRRNLIKTGGVLAVSGMTGLSGCLDFFSDSGTTVGDAGTWLVAPESIDRDHYQFLYTSPSKLADVSDDLDRDSWDGYQDDFVDVEYANPLPSEIDEAIWNTTYTVFVGEFDTDRMVSNMERDDYGFTSEHGDFELYTPNDDSDDEFDFSESNTGYAINDETVIRAFGRNELGPAEILERIIDVSSGDGERYGDRNEHMGQLLDELPTGHIAFAETFERREESYPEEGVFRDLVAEGYSLEVDGEESDTTLLLVFVDESSVTERDIETFVDAGEQFSDWRTVDYDIDENIVTFDGRIRTRDV